MLTAFLTGAAMAFPLVAVAGLLMLAERLHRAEQLRVAWQIAVTNAIHRELGAVVAPSISTRPWVRPRLVIPVPADRPALVARVLDISQRVLQGWEGSAARRVQIVVVPQRVATPERTSPVGLARAA